MNDKEILNDLHNKLVILEERQAINTNKIEAIHKIVVGNGNIGIFSKVEIMWRITIFLIVTVAGLVITEVVGAMAK